MDFGAPSHAKRALCKLKRGIFIQKVRKIGWHVPPVPPPMFLHHAHTTSLKQNEGIRNALRGLKIKARRV